MSYQDIKRAIVKLAPPLNIEEADRPVWDAIRQTTEAYSQLAQEVVLCHNSIQQFTVNSVAATTVNVTLPAPAKTALYYIGAMFPATNGGYWVTAQSTTGFTLTWATAVTGTIRILFLE